jgi:two-component system CheB/CheR fusion protein
MNEHAASDVDRLLRLLVDQTNEHAVMLLDVDGRIAWWNAGAEQIFGYAAADIAGEPLARLFTAEDIALGLPGHELAVARSGDAAEDDRWLVRADGSRFWATGVTIGLRDERSDCVGFGKVLRNRTDLMEQLEALRNRVADLEEASRRKDIFLSTLSHELRGPLSPLRNAAALIRMTAAASRDVEEPLRIIDRQVDALARLVDDLLDVARIGAGKVELDRQAVALQDVVGRAVETCAPIVAERGHRLEVLAAPRPIVVDADADRLQQVFANLITNAAKYTPRGGGIWVKTATEGEEAVVHVEDTGVGIPPDMLPRIFDLFTQVESSRAQSRQGLGIGLALVKELATLHGGSVQVRSEGKDKGSKFTVRLPLARPSRRD